jgi:HEAT repeat protein
MVTHSAARALARQRDGAALRWLLRHPRSFAHRTPRARFEMLRAFGPGAHAMLLDALERGVVNAGLQRAIVDTLGAARERLGSHAIAALLGHDDAEIRVAAARALGAIGAQETALQLCVALRDPAWPVRAQAARALGRLRASEAVAPLAAGLEDRAWWVRHHAAYALAKLGEEGRAELDRIRRSSSDRYAREMADEALAAI